MIESLITEFKKICLGVLGFILGCSAFGLVLYFLIFLVNNKF
ncbi:hypothetical protein [Motilimonas sp. KMU-193]